MVIVTPGFGGHQHGLALAARPDSVFGNAFRIVVGRLHRRAAWPRAWLALMVLGLLSGCSPVRTVEAARLLADIGRLQDGSSAARTPIAYPGTSAPRVADIYRPETTRAALVLVPGAAERARRDPRLVGFAEALRRRGFLVLVPALAGADPLQVSAADAEAIADAVRHLTGSAGFDQVGLAALSYAVGPTILAALEPDVAPGVGFIVAIGGYHDIVAAIAFVTTGAFREEPGAPWRRQAVNARAKWLFLRANAARIDEPEDARLLGEIAQRRLARPDADTGALAARLGPQGRAVHRLLVNQDPERVPALVAALPQRLRGEIAALDLASRDLARLHADLILIHGRNDPLVPYTESVDLARAADGAKAYVYLLNGLDHVDLRGLGPSDIVALLGAAYRVLLERDMMAPGSPGAPVSARPRRRHSRRSRGPRQSARGRRARQRRPRPWRSATPSPSRSRGSP